MKRTKLIIILAIMGTVSLFARNYDAVPEDTKIKWTGKKVTGEHFGYINLKSGSMQVDGNKITGGEFVMDMTSITVTDIEDDETNKKLVGHLKSDDFFSVANFNESKLVIKEASPFKDGKAKVTAELTIKGKSNPVEFVATKKGDNSYAALITVDRTKYDVRYGSGKFFENLGDRMIYDDFTLDIHLKAK